ncbi:MAG: hypothetical protein M2R45_04688 [Verrucomicrobia subdivision 3 bacterium]|nr:hypothetical protein [Limisphaerales bacterium]MCS1416611.1 hypothetical protein [Limisphaerales bacterium]
MGVEVTFRKNDRGADNEIAEQIMYAALLRELKTDAGKYAHPDAVADDQPLGDE